MGIDAQISSRLGELSIASVHFLEIAKNVLQLFVEDVYSLLRFLPLPNLHF